MAYKGPRSNRTRYVIMPNPGNPMAPGAYLKGSQSGHHITTMSPKKNSMTKSERDFEAGQKLKAKELKKTGVYKNTAN